MSVDKKIPTSAFTYSPYTYDTRVIISDPEALQKTEHPKILLSRPEIVAPIALPLIEYGNSSVRYGMHTDMISTLIHRIADLKPETREGLYIQGRMPNKEQWERLEDNSVYNFFLRGRSWRSEKSHQLRIVEGIHQPAQLDAPEGFGVKKYIEMIIPKGLSLTNQQVRDYSHMKYSPDTTIDGLEDIPTAWYQAGWIHELYFRTADVDITSNSFQPLWGGMNEFLIGSNTLVPGKVRKAAFEFRQGFERAIEESALDSVKPDQKMLSEFDVIEI